MRRTIKRERDARYTPLLAVTGKRYPPCKHVNNGNSPTMDCVAAARGIYDPSVPDKLRNLGRGRKRRKATLHKPRKVRKLKAMREPVKRMRTPEPVAVWVVTLNYNGCIFEESYSSAGSDLAAEKARQEFVGAEIISVGGDRLEY